VLKAKVHRALLPDQDGLRLLLEAARGGLSRLSHLWLDAGYAGRGRRWAEEQMGSSVFHYPVAASLDHGRPLRHAFFRISQAIRPRHPKRPSENPRTYRFLGEDVSSVPCLQTTRLWLARKEFPNSFSTHSAE